MNSKKIFLLLFISHTVLTFSQSKKEIEIRNFFWGSHDKYKDAVSIPDAWKDESAVVIYKNVNYDYHKYGNKITYKHSLRKRIKILDKSALESFSEFSYIEEFRSKKGGSPYKKGEISIHLKIIKSTGKTIEIDTQKNAVVVDGETKLAIANLEIGDILDYYILVKEPFKADNVYSFPAIETTLSDEYPIMDFKLYIESENDFFINFNSFNGAPQLKELPNKKRSLKKYSLEASNIEKEVAGRWVYPLVEFPSYKFQVYFIRAANFAKRASGFIAEKAGTIKKDVTEEDIINYFDWAYKKPSINNSEYSTIKKYFKTHTFKTNSDKVIAAYYLMRHHYYNRYIDYIEALQAKITYASPVMPLPFISESDKGRFFYRFRDFLIKNDIDYNYIITRKRYDGPLDELLLANNLSFMIRVNTPKPLFINFYGLHKGINTLPYLIENNDAYLLKADKNKVSGLKKIVLPMDPYTANETRKSIVLTVNDDFKSINTTILNTYKGHAKVFEQNERLLFSDFIENDHKKYGTESLNTYIQTNKLISKKTRADFIDKLKALKDKQEGLQKEYFIKAVKEIFEIEDLENYSYNFKNLGRFDKTDDFAFEEKFDIKEQFIKKAGKNYILEIGKFISGQINILEDEKLRKENIYMNYPRALINEITLNIPEGYTVSGIDKLNKNIDNQTGAFISKAEIVENKLIIKTSKFYKHNYEPHTNWDLMVAFLDAAHQFTNEKILLKKK